MPDFIQMMRELDVNSSMQRIQDARVKPNRELQQKPRDTVAHSTLPTSHTRLEPRQEDELKPGKQELSTSL